MRTIAFVGPSGTGKSYRATQIARKNGADAFIDDGLLISGSKVLAGVSAKREPTKIASVKRALFTTAEHAKSVKRAISDYHINKVMILGTSDAMVRKIAEVLGIAPIEKTIYITDVASEEEMEYARERRRVHGQHVIPAPTFEIKKDFSGYFLHPFRLFQRNMDRAADIEGEEKSIVRPTFSYMGNFEISDNVIARMAAFEAKNHSGVERVVSVNIRKTSHGVHMDMDLMMRYGFDIMHACRQIQYRVQKNIEAFTSVNMRRVHIYVRGVKR
jgi:uncharacterized alkaline shock family protein YloU/adenylate kinase family enzyme